MVSFLNSTVRINKSFKDFLNKEETVDSSAIKLRPREYVITVRCPVDFPVLVHELWHIFMDCLESLDSGEISCSELKKDIYAYSFEKLIRDIIEEINDDKR